MYLLCIYVGVSRPKERCGGKVTQQGESFVWGECECGGGGDGRGDAKPAGFLNPLVKKHECLCQICQFGVPDREAERWSSSCATAVTVFRHQLRIHHVWTLAALVALGLKDSLIAQSQGHGAMCSVAFFLLVVATWRAPRVLHASSPFIRFPPANHRP